MAGLTRIKSDGIGDDCDLDGEGTLVLDSTNNRVGINTTAPDKHLHVYSATGDSIVRFESGDATCTLQFKDNTSTAGIGNDGGTLVAYTNNAFGSSNVKMRLDNSGRLVLNNSTATSTSKLQVTAHTDAEAVAINGRSTDDISNFTFFENDRTTILGRLQARQTYFQISGSDTTEGIYIDNNGDVGINTTAPQSLLHIQGPTDAADQARLTISERRNTGTTNWGIDFLRTYDSGGDNQAAGFIRCIRDGGASNAGMVFGIGNRTDTSREKMRINSSGSVFITPSSTGMTRAIAGTNHAHLVVHTDESGTSAYRAIEIGTDVADDTSTGGLLCGKRKDQTHTPTVIASCWDNGLSNTVYFGGGWSTGGAPMNELRFYTTSSYTSGAATGNQVMTIDSSGRLLVNATSAITTDSFRTIQTRADGGAGLVLARSDTTTTSGEKIGAIHFFGNDSNGTYEECATIEVEADGTHANDDKPTRMMFFTTPSGDDSAVERMRIQNDGDIQVMSGDIRIDGGGKGIVFPPSNTGSANANTLDDYEEGTYTPTIGGSSTAGSVTAGNRYGRYIKIGKMVYATIRMENVTFSGSSGAIRISLPFTAVTTPAYSSVGAAMTHNVSFNTDQNQAWYASGANMYGMQSRNGATWTDWTSSSFHTSGLYMNQLFVYEADT